MAKDDKLNLDIDNPDEVADILRAAADAYYGSAVDLEGAWGEKSAGKPWEIIAQILEKAADQIDSKI